MNTDNRRLDMILAAGVFALLVLPWYRVRQGLFSLDWIGDVVGTEKLWPGLFQALIAGRWQLWPVLGLLAAAVLLRTTRAPGARGRALIGIGLAGLAWLLVEGLSVGLRGWNWGLLEQIFGDVAGQQAFGGGAVVLGTVFALIAAFGAAERGALKGDAFVLGAITILVLLVAVFVFYPLVSMFTGAFQDFDGSFTTEGVRSNIVDPKIWSLACLTGGNCGVAWRTFFLAVCTATGTTLMGLVFALVATRTGFPYKKSLRLLTVLPIITRPLWWGLR